jgi:eukaryotic-like serine/threonine-protein kinase
MPGHVTQLNTALEGRYTIEREIGQGGMATVFLARDVRHDRNVALKVLRPELAAVLGAERFLAEIKITANLRHPHILPLFDSGEADGFLFYVMPYVAGETLRDRLRREGSLAVEEALSITRDVAHALDYAHGHGVIHRDVKPENILLGEGGPVIADFGIALAISEAGGDRLTEAGLSLGTPTYMSPEQATGESDATPASDVYALACVLHEMLAGDPPFSGATLQAVMARVMTEPPPSIRSVQPSVSRDIEAAILRGLAKRPEERSETAGEFARSLDAASAVDIVKGGISRRRGRAVVITVALVGVLLGLTSVKLYRELADQRWVRQVAIPDIERLLSESSVVEAFRTAREAARIAPDDPSVRRLLEASSRLVSGDTDPSGVAVWYRGYSTVDSTWYSVGQTPLEEVVFPVAYLRLRLEKEGYEPLEVAFLPLFGLDATLVPQEADGESMVSVPSGSWSYTTPDPVDIDGFLLDKYEVTNAAFQRFVDAGGYRSAQYWTEPFARDAEPLTWEEGIALLEDATGRPGPATWKLSRYPEGEADHPVGGVSWYEAVAYCGFVGKRLPTFYHWKQAAGLDVFDDVLAFSNFSGEGPQPVGSGGGPGPNGTLDQAGNVKEWTWNTSRGGLRYILGGAWNEPRYTFQDANARDPLTRDPTHGFRCARYDTPRDSPLMASIDLPYFDFNEIEPVDDATFATLASFFAYDPGPLGARVETVDSTSQWRRETVSFNAAYGGERVLAHVLLPRNVAPPYQTVVYMPGIDALFLSSSENLANWHLLSFIPQSGRALVFPVYKGTYERRYQRLPGNIARREYTVQVTQDLNRTVDYITERADLDEGRLGYMGVSYGAEWTIPLTMEPRFAAASLIGGAYDAQWLDGPGALPETSPWNFTSRMVTPTVLINGRYDFQHPYETGQVPFYSALGAPEEHKKFVLLETGHIPPWNDVIRATLDWFDTHLGVVDPSSSAEALGEGR